MKAILVSCPSKVLKGKLVLPASKSISNRLLLIRALSGEDFTIHNISEADDTRLLQKLLEEIRTYKGNRVLEMDTANAGTVMRFLTAYLAARPGKWMLTGSERMKQRPIAVLAEALNNLGAAIDYLAKIGYPPILIKGQPLTGKEVTIDAGISSQYSTALLLVAPYLPSGLILHQEGTVVSTPYIRMTTRLMQYYGARIKTGKQRIAILPGVYKSRDFTIEADWSAASFWYEAAAFAEDVDLQLNGLFPNSLQGDDILPAIYQNFGIKTEFNDQGIHLTRVRKKVDGFYFDFTDFPDIAPSVITTCAALGIRSRFEGLRSLRIKETDRLRALKNELEKLGLDILVSAPGDVMPSLEFNSFQPGFRTDLTFETYGDHRMAMTFAPLALKMGSIRIMDPDVVVKSYPCYWEHLQELGFIIH
ncbi:MAG: 3-phosphoshikimate 1-carboxyvinyltransferase [Bacteroidales bacterium]|nr:3-phosphoshikimate 1-carboxyvinyltransferase [Bacteroidales bacterium]